ncbi:hypothetical protein EMPS_08171 [Entomortierella parvispora]|uniref:Uncharacterized protein n=1 Tax=Entomortierella parvispora TaxID=205924 RepID=A0A9P3HG81_9FUNG|nr:hypothetical protein EMPS_08171 [Entomortierella parvispora]
MDRGPNAREVVHGQTPQLTPTMTDFSIFTLSDSNSRFASFFKRRPPVEWTFFREFVDVGQPISGQYQKYIRSLDQISVSPEVPPLVTSPSQQQKRSFVSICWKSAKQVWRLSAFSKSNTRHVSSDVDAQQ